MKRCPSCNRTFEEDWLSFCTQDGTALIDDSTVAATTAAAPLPTQAAAAFDQQAVWSTPAAGDLAVAETPSPQSWQPPPPPNLGQTQSKGLATAAMIFGIIGVTCFGPIFGIVAIILGAVSLSQMKKDPQGVGGRQQAITGVVLGSASVLISGIILIIYILMIVAATTNK